MVQDYMVIVQYLGFKGTYTNFALFTRHCLSFMRQSLCIKGSHAEPGNQEVITRTKIESIHQQYKSMKTKFPISIF